ncbi:cell wall-binding repeat-containing protein [Agromyces sp. G08B096]|uniref:Cell wall-binding repeat-containing protein n=1 Tax=Agromyces sp. G08B096 TaxID=3156399 RepID=A0AAU7WAV9_9MICO
MGRKTLLLAIALTAACLSGIAGAAPAIGATWGAPSPHIAPSTDAADEPPPPAEESDPFATDPSATDLPATDPPPTVPVPTVPAPAPSAPDEVAPSPEPTVVPPGDPGTTSDGATLRAAATVIEPFGAGTHRLAGADRFATAVAISGRFQPGVPVVYLATGLDFADALAAAAAAARQGGPLLITTPDVLPAVIRDELIRLAPAQIVVAGSELAISPAVFAEVATLAPVVHRIGGADRYETADLLIDGAFPVATQAYVATGRAFPDALAASAAAAEIDAPVFLIDGLAAVVRDESIALMRSLGVRTVRIAGGDAAVGTALERDLDAAGFAVVRHQGADRYQTAAAINEAVFGDEASIPAAFLTTGGDFADALGGAALAGGIGSPIYLVRTECVPPEVADALVGLAPSARVVLGGLESVGEPVARGIECAVVWTKPATGRITDGFGPRAPICTPGGCTQSFHRGTDIATGCWAPIRAASSGRVVTAGVVGTYGNFVKIDHGSGIQTGYAHLSNGGVLVRVGQYVQVGDQIGWSGATGAATGCHLHYEVYVNGSQVDPVPFMLSRGVMLG